MEKRHLNWSWIRLRQLKCWGKYKWGRGHSKDKGWERRMLFSNLRKGEGRREKGEGVASAGWASGNLAWKEAKAAEAYSFRKTSKKQWTKRKRTFPQSSRPPAIGNWALHRPVPITPSSHMLWKSQKAGIRQSRKSCLQLRVGLLLHPELISSTYNIIFQPYWRTDLFSTF